MTRIVPSTVCVSTKNATVNLAGREIIAKRKSVSIVVRVMGAVIVQNTPSRTTTANTLVVCAKKVGVVQIAVSRCVLHPASRDGELVWKTIKQELTSVIVLVALSALTVPVLVVPITVLGMGSAWMQNASANLVGVARNVSQKYVPW